MDSETDRTSLTHTYTMSHPDSEDPQPSQQTDSPPTDSPPTDSPPTDSPPNENLFDSPGFFPEHF